MLERQKLFFCIHTDGHRRTSNGFNRENVQLRNIVMNC